MDIKEVEQTVIESGSVVVGVPANHQVHFDKGFVCGYVDSADGQSPWFVIELGNSNVLGTCDTIDELKQILQQI